MQLLALDKKNKFNLGVVCALILDVMKIFPNEEHLFVYHSINSRVSFSQL